MTTLLHDLRLAYRTLSRQWVFTTATVAILAVAIAAGLVVHSIVSSVLFRPFSYRDPDSLVLIYARDLSPTASATAQRGAAGAHEIGLSIPDLADFRRTSKTLTGLVPITPFAANLTGIGDPIRVHGASVGADFFSVLGVTMAHGSGFVDTDDALRGDAAVVLTDGFWRRQLGGDPAAAERRLLLDGVSYRIAGVLPVTFESLTGEAHELYRAVRPPVASGQRGVRFWPAVARLNNANLTTARAELASIAATLAREYPTTNRNMGVAIYALNDLTPPQTRTALLFLLGAVLLVFVVTCANLANLRIADSAGRLRETAIKLTLGASSWRLLRQSIGEGLLIATAGCVGGSLMARWALDLVKAFAPAIPRLDRATIDASSILWITAAIVIVGLALAIAPWSQAIRAASDVQLNTRVIGDRRRTTVMNTIVVVQISAAVLLVGAAGLMLRSLQRLSQVDPGFRAADVLTFHVPLARAQFDRAQSAARFAAVRDRLANVPGVTATGAALQLPLSGLDVDLTQLQIEGVPAVAPEQEPAVRLHVITPGYFSAMGVPLREGRHLTDGDTAEAPGVVVINDAMARRLWPNQDPIGRRITQRLTFTPGENPERTVVGVVGNIKHFGLQFPDEPQMYIPHAQSPWPAMSFAVRASVAPERLVPSLRAAVEEVDPALPIDDVRLMTEVMAAATGEPRFRASLVTAYAAVSTMLAFLGLYAVLAHSVSQRTREIGVRMAVGATPGGIQWLVLAEAGRSAFLGGAIGFIALAVTVRLIEDLLFGVSRFEPAIVLGSIAMVGVCTAVACAMPARRAARIDPVVTLRGE